MAVTKIYDEYDSFLAGNLAGEGSQGREGWGRVDRGGGRVREERGGEGKRGEGERERDRERGKERGVREEESKDQRFKCSGR